MHSTRQNDVLWKPPLTVVRGGLHPRRSLELVVESRQLGRLSQESTVPRSASSAASHLDGAANDCCAEPEVKHETYVSDTPLASQHSSTCHAELGDRVFLSEPLRNDDADQELSRCSVADVAPFTEVPVAVQAESPTDPSVAMTSKRKANESKKQGESQGESQGQGRGKSRVKSHGKKQG